jgi:DNA-binding response OmpR family regulator
MPRILIVEDEPEMARGLRYNLEARGYDVSLAADGETGYQAALAQRPDLVVLDIMLPKQNGYEVCRALRKVEPILPVLMLTARGGEDDLVLGLKLGADDYMRKPFSVAELVARIEALLRRSTLAGRNMPRLEFGGIVVNFERHKATKRGEPLELTPKEFEMVRYFAARAGVVVSRDALLNAVWGYTSAPNTRTVDTHIVKLRQKLEDTPSSPKHLLTVHGVGYKFVP